MKKLIIIIAATIISSGLSAQIKNVEMLTRVPTQYERTDFKIELTGNWVNPYLENEAALWMELISPSGKEQLLPCYYESGASGELSIWKARFNPQESGIYKYDFVYYERQNPVVRSDAGEFNARPSDRDGFLHVNDNWTLKFDSGKPFRGVAENICWESRDNDDSRFFKELHEEHDKYNYDYLLPQFSQNGGNFIRVWMCGWNFPIDSQGPRFNNSRYTASDEYYNPSATARLDHFVNLCEDLDIYVMLCMGQGAVSADREFFVSDAAKERYKNRLRYIVSRWGYSPSIGMWEFFNEIDNIQFRDNKNPIPAADIVAWHTEMSTYLKSIDPYGHIVTTSISHRDLEGLNSIPDIDINQKHIYNKTSILPEEIIRYTEKFGKPYIIGEFGYEWDWHKNFDDFGDGMDEDFRRGLWYGIFSPTPVTPMSWWWEYFENRDMVPYFRGVRQISDKMLAEGGGEFEMVPARLGCADAYGLKTGDVLYAYLFNETEDLIAENFHLHYELDAPYKAQAFDPTALTYTDLGTVSAKGGIELSGIELGSKSEILLIFTPI